MTARGAHRRATLLFYAALAFVVLTTIAMRVYPGYAFWDNFLSDLGMTHTWAGRPNYPAMLLFGSALSTIGIALVAFATTWRTFAFRRERAAALGGASEVFGCLSGCAFVALALAPVDRMLDDHNGLVVAAFALLLLYTVSLTIVWGYNAATRPQLLSCVAYVVIVLVYFAVVIYAARVGIGTQRARDLLIGSQKIMVYASMAYVMYLSLVIQAALGRRS